MDWQEHSGTITEGEWYCDSLECWCHTDVEYHDVIQHPAYSDEDIEQACGFYGVGAGGVVWQSGYIG